MQLHGNALAFPISTIRQISSALCGQPRLLTAMTTKGLPCQCTFNVASGRTVARSKLAPTAIIVATVYARVQRRDHAVGCSLILAARDRDMSRSLFIHPDRRAGSLVDLCVNRQSLTPSVSLKRCSHVKSRVETQTQARITSLSPCAWCNDSKKTQYRQTGTRKSHNPTTTEHRARSVLPPRPQRHPSD